MTELDSAEARGVEIQSSALSADGTRWAVARAHGEIEIHHYKTSTLLAKVPVNQGLTEKILFTPGGDALVVLAAGTVSVLSTTSNEKHRVAVRSKINDVDISADGHFLAMADADGHVWIAPVHDLSKGIRQDLVLPPPGEDDAGDLGPPLDLDSYRVGERIVLGMAKVRFAAGGPFLVGLHTRGKGCVWDASVASPPLVCFDGPRGRRLGLEVARETFRVLTWGDEFGMRGSPSIHDFPLEERTGEELRRAISALPPDSLGPT